MSKTLLNNVDFHYFMEEIATIHYIVHPLWFLDNDRDKTISLVDKLTELGKMYGQNTGTMFVMDMNGTSEYFDTCPRGWCDEKLEEERRVVKKLHRKYAQKLDRELNRSCRIFHPEVPYHIPEVRHKSKYENGRIFTHFGRPLLSGGFQSFLKDRDLKLINGVNMFGHGAIRDACVEEGLKYFAEAIRNTSGVDSSYEICLETTLE